MINYILKSENVDNSTYVSGRDRLLFHGKPYPSTTPTSYDPISPATEETAIELQRAAEENLAKSRQKSAKICRSWAVQTDYRESATQTDPYTPKEQVREGEHPEILHIKHFAWGRELPPTVAELMKIEELREKRAFEEALPQ